ncbi:MAG: hypothetical protein HY986_18635 [Candidatus Melainabacteria bacterium]|nr:hypothetical protein [Candidatus Melainabacteria bacterium]
MNQGKTSKDKGLLDRVFSDIFERELRACAEETYEGEKYVNGATFTAAAAPEGTGKSAEATPKVETDSREKPVQTSKQTAETEKKKITKTVEIVVGQAAKNADTDKKKKATKTVEIVMEPSSKQTNDPSREKTLEKTVEMPIKQETAFVESKPEGKLEAKPTAKSEGTEQEKSEETSDGKPEGKADENAASDSQELFARPFQEVPSDFISDYNLGEESETGDYDSSEGYENGYSDWSYETPRPWLSIDEAASVLGRSSRAVERSILGRWGNRLPEGWSARLVKIDGADQDQWRVIPPPGFRLKANRKTATVTTEIESEASKATEEQEAQAQTDSVLQTKVETNTKEGDDCQEGTNRDLTDRKNQAQGETTVRTESTGAASPAKGKASHKSKEEDEMSYKTSRDDSFSFGPLEKLFQSASRIAQKELASFVNSGRKERHELYKPNLEATTIVIDRSDEVEKLLRELADCQRELAQERRARMEDMRLINEMQSSMRLLEVNARETRQIKEDLIDAQTALLEHRKQYQEFLKLPWWKRLFHKKQA